jgi:hypothetical protein
MRERYESFVIEDGPAGKAMRATAITRSAAP